MSEYDDDFEVFGSGDLVESIVSFYEFFNKNHDLALVCRIHSS
jgi:hypothetical protein